MISHLEVDFDSILRPFFERKRLGLVLELLQITREIEGELLAWSLELTFVDANRHYDESAVWCKPRQKEGLNRREYSCTR